MEKEGGDVQKANFAVVVKKKDSVFVAVRKRQTGRVMKGSCFSREKRREESWKTERAVSFQSCHGKYIFSI